MRSGKASWLALMLVVFAIGGLGLMKLFGGGGGGAETPAPIMVAPAPIPVTEAGEAPLPEAPAAAETPEPEPEASTPAPAPGPDIGAIRSKVASGDPAEARRELMQAYFAPGTTPAQRDQLEPMMLAVSQVLVIEKPGEEDFEFYRVQSGDNLINVAKAFRSKGYPHVEYGLLKMFNKLGKDLIRVGQRLRIPKGQVSIVVRKSTFKLYVFYQGIAFASYDVAIGADASATPSGVYKTADKTARPTWWPPESTGLRGPIGPDDPKNPLGTHWIALDHDLHSGLGIHGTNDPNMIGTRASLGCIRMRNHEVKEIFEIARSGMAVHVMD